VPAKQNHNVSSELLEFFIIH